MKVINFIYAILLCCLFWTCANDDVDKNFDGNDDQFVRFFMLVDNNNRVLEYPEINGGLIPVSNYTKDNAKTLKIPVALTSEAFTGQISVRYETTVSGLNDVDISPLDDLTFTSTQLVDTIYVNFNERWDLANNPQLQFRLVSASDPRIQIGMPNSTSPNDVLTINFEDLNFTYRFPSPNQTEIIGTLGETVNFSVEFPNGYIASEVDGIELFSESLSNFDYNLEQLELTDDTRVDYTLTLNDNVQIDELEFKTIFSLNEIAGYTINGSTNYTIKKPIVTVRDNSVFTSNNFYNLSDPFHRTYGEHWFDFNEDGVCSWQSYFAFTFPVVVSADHPNAVLFDDMGTPDPSDDVYHHAFRIGFNSTNSTGTTNSFDLRRWFNNESTSQANSPGFNITEALEFFPTNGTSTTDGFVQVIEQDILISSTSGSQYIIAISGSGTYSEISPGLFEIQLEFNATNQDLFGGTRTDIYRIYNSTLYPDPADLSDLCEIPIDL